VQRAASIRKRKWWTVLFANEPMQQFSDAHFLRKDADCIWHACAWGIFKDVFSTLCVLAAVAELRATSSEDSETEHKH